MPVVDFSQLGDEPCEAAWRAAGEAIEAAFREHGFVYVVNHGVPEDAVAGVMAASEEFFKLSTDEKNTWKVSAEHGYLSLGRQRIMENYELRESFDVRDLDGPFPDASVPELRRACAELTGHLATCGSQFFTALEYGLGLEKGRLVHAHSMTLSKPTIKPWLRMANYPPVPAEFSPGTMRVDCHTDYGSITFDVQDELGGLEVRNRQGEWVLAKSPQKGAIVVIIGDMLEKWTRGKFIATEHRVRIPDSEHLRKLPRRSIIFFFQADDEVTLAPFDGSSSETPHMTAREYINHRHTKTLNY